MAAAQYRRLKVQSAAFPWNVVCMRGLCQQKLLDSIDLCPVNYKESLVDIFLLGVHSNYSKLGVSPYHYK